MANIMSGAAFLAGVFSGSGYNDEIFRYLFLPLLVVAAGVYSVWPRRHLEIATQLLCMIWGTAIVYAAVGVLGSYWMNSNYYRGHCPPVELGLWVVAGLAVIFGCRSIRACDSGRKPREESR